MKAPLKGRLQHSSTTQRLMPHVGISGSGEKSNCGSLFFCECSCGLETSISNKTLLGLSRALFHTIMGPCVLSHFSHIWLFVTLYTVAHQTPLSMGFSRQEYWSGLPCPPPGDLPNPGIEPRSLTSPAMAGRFLTTSATWETHNESRYPKGMNCHVNCPRVSKVAGGGWRREKVKWVCLIWSHGAKWSQFSLSRVKGHLVTSGEEKEIHICYPPAVCQTEHSISTVLLNP